jgi:Holliday junction resolvase
MQDVERILGSLEEAKKTTEKRLDVIEKKIDKLHEFKWRIAGGSAVLVFVLTALAEVFRR